MSSLRTTLGIKRKMHPAMEDIKETNQEVIVMKGPLAEIYTQALDAAYSKTDPLIVPDPEKPIDMSGQDTGAGDPSITPADQTPLVEADKIPAATQLVLESLGLESQEQDAALIMALRGSMMPQAPASDEYMTLYAVAENDIKPADVVNVTELLSQSKNPEDITVSIDNQIPPNSTDIQTPEEKAVAANLAIGLESIVLGLGGKVIHSLKDLVVSRRKV